MTSTSFNVGLKDGTRLSSRVLRPPGGGHTDIFGGEPEPPRGRRAVPNTQSISHIGQGDEPKPSNGVEHAQNGQAAEPPSPVAELPSPPAELPSPPAPEPQPESPAKAEPAKPEPAKAEPAITPPGNDRAEPPKRVRVPPGGFSSGLW